MGFFKTLVRFFRHIRRFGGGQTQPLNTFKTVGSSSVKALSANGARSGLTFSNSSAVNLWLSPGQAAVVGSGILLTPGATRDFSQYANSSPIFLGDWYCIGESGTTNNLGISEQYN